MKDTVWIPEVARQGWLIITRDRHIQEHRLEIAAVRDHAAKMIALTGEDASSVFAQLEVVMSRWRDIERCAAEPAPFIYGVTRTGIRKISLFYTARHPASTTCNWPTDLPAVGLTEAGPGPAYLRTSFLLHFNATTIVRGSLHLALSSQLSPTSATCAGAFGQAGGSEVPSVRHAVSDGQPQATPQCRSRQGIGAPTTGTAVRSQRSTVSPRLGRPAHAGESILSPPPCCS
ncbi:hypothetical protein KBX71_06650 [Micromonospora sp. D93]|uniref:PIN-like domain-containing protein n=1 Tax=Micromonospora sp. D93 TaxID=2824886 RepID=UPI001B3824FD|nr:hypothetical protein [Micromonospora sp. D93]MBQ1017547.1 hypothetical protein [Micromonospora sp. D93]